MREIIILSMFIILLTSLASAEIILGQVDNIYNLGDTLSTTATIKTNIETEEIFYTFLICDGIPREIVPKQYIELQTGGEKTIEIQLKLIKSFIGEQKGECIIKTEFGNFHSTSDSFIISNFLNITANLEEEFKPEEKMIIEGTAIKENKKPVEGFIELEISETKAPVIYLVTNGRFKIEYDWPKDTKARQYLINLRVYEKDKNEEITNQGYASYTISVTQIPTSLEIVFENSEVEPGTNLMVKAILHDQTGEKIESNAIITIKNEDNKILEQTEKPADEFLEFPIVYNEPPAEWTAVAVSNKITTETSFKIKEKKDMKIEIINKTLILTNIGNVFYNETVLVKIGNDTKTINDVNLEVDESQKYILSAPDGEYSVEIITDGETKITKSVLLTGKAIDVKKASSRVITLVRYPFVWVFIIAVLGFVAFIIFKKGYKKSFFGYIHSKKKEKSRLIPLRKKSMINTKNKAELSLSIKGDKQNVSVVCLKIKNLKEIESKKSNAEETLQKIVDITEENKAVTYENQEDIFFILAPIKTRTFKNEKIAMEIAQKIKEVLTHHNKLAKQKIEFGISLNYGTIIAKQEKDSLKFMSMGTLITTAKKIASLPNNEILLSEKIKDRLMSDIKTEKHTKGKISVYTIKEIKNKEEHKKFIRSFLDRIEGKK